ncbi:hypothetical protein LI171_15055 [Emergencia timonensis]|uniref:hypothetical protein n=1 Tax=Emergencia timonensis TaxID=1776384 RepID=UPI001D06D417|nr:hypothetical protein [Emergencia timonensis]MCB6477566.1 hypothetical protein [Emergencia timonensis]
MNRINKPTQEYYFDPYQKRVEESMDDLKNYLGDVEAQKILKRLLDDVYRTGFSDGMEFARWLED